VPVGHLNERCRWALPLPPLLNVGDVQDGVGPCVRR
jgi:hypothetical protein